MRKLILGAASSCIIISCAIAQSAPSIKPEARHRQPAQSVLQWNGVAPSTADEKPASPPEVIFEGGILTISASNSTLGEILRAVQKVTGASVDLAEDASERVVGRFGPGRARDVLSALLNGTRFNFVLLGSATNSSDLQRVMLIPKTPETKQSAPPANTASAQRSLSAQAPEPAPMSSHMTQRPLEREDVWGGARRSSDEDTVPLPPASKQSDDPARLSADDD